MERALRDWKTNAYEKQMHIDLYYKDIFEKNGASICPILFDHNFCIQNDNDAPIDFYIKCLRKVSCVQHKFYIIYWISLLKFYFRYVVLIILLVVILCIYFALRKKYRGTYLGKKVATLFAK